jgi:hypothetical protein
LDFSTIFHTTSVWLFRIAILGGLAGAGYLYMTTDKGMPDAQFDAAPRYTSAADGSTTECQPIGHTARGELIYSMDCEQLPTPSDAAGTASGAK